MMKKFFVRHFFSRNRGTKEARMTRASTTAIFAGLFLSIGGLSASAQQKATVAPGGSITVTGANAPAAKKVEKVKNQCPGRSEDTIAQEKSFCESGVVVEADKEVAGVYDEDMCNCDVSGINDARADDAAPYGFCNLLVGNDGKRDKGRARRIHLVKDCVTDGILRGIPYEEVKNLRKEIDGDQNACKRLDANKYKGDEGAKEKEVDDKACHSGLKHDLAVAKKHAEVQTLQDNIKIDDLTDRVAKDEATQAEVVKLVKATKACKAVQEEKNGGSKASPEDAAECTKHASLEDDVDEIMQELAGEPACVRLLQPKSMWMENDPVNCAAAANKGLRFTVHQAHEVAAMAGEASQQNADAIEETNKQVSRLQPGFSIEGVGGVQIRNPVSINNHVVRGEAGSVFGIDVGLLRMSVLQLDLVLARATDATSDPAGNLVTAGGNVAGIFAGALWPALVPSGRLQVGFQFGVEYNGTAQTIGLNQPVVASVDFLIAPAIEYRLTDVFSVFAKMPIGVDVAHATGTDPVSGIFAVYTGISIDINRSPVQSLK